MKQQHTLTFFISLFLVFVFCGTAVAQNDNKDKEPEKANDTTKTKAPRKFSLRFGVDISKLVRSAIDDDYSGLEIIGDLRFSKNWYAALEIGSEDNLTTTDNLEVLTSGSYFKAGADYNLYENWFGMENMIYSGFRIGASTFSHQRNRFTIFNTDQYWPTQFEDDTVAEFNGLSMLWLEVILGIKAELFKNIYAGLNVQLKRVLTQDRPDNFDNLYSPGFNRTYDNSNFGVGFGYSISYLIPFYKKKLPDDQKGDNTKF